MSCPNLSCPLSPRIYSVHAPCQYKCVASYEQRWGLIAQSDSNSILFYGHWNIARFREEKTLHMIPWWDWLKQFAMHVAITVERISGGQPKIEYDHNKQQC